MAKGFLLNCGERFLLVYVKNGGFFTKTVKQLNMSKDLPNNF